MECSECGFALPDGARFCAGCGVPLEIVAPKTAPRRQRRQLTVMFCDIVGSTERAGSMDAEDWLELLHRYQHRATEAVTRFGGYVAQFLGDGLLVYFGYPIADENNAESAVRAGLAILDSLAVRDAPALQVRIGIHTGVVVLSEVGAGENKQELAMGETTHLAARLEAIAPPDQIVISDETLRLMRGSFETVALEPQRLKGFDEPVLAHRIIGARGEPGQRGRAAAELPLVGRARELAALDAAHARADRGGGCWVAIGGEPGVGKSRLVAAFRQALPAEGHRWYDAIASPYSQGTALAPIAELLLQLIGRHRDDGEHEILDALESATARVGQAPGRTVPLAARLLGLDCAARFPAPEQDVAAQRSQLLEFIAALLFASAEDSVVVLRVEDAQWLDPSSVEAIQLILSRLPTARALVLATFRSGFEPGWDDTALATTLTLSPLAEQAIRELVRGAAGAVPLSEETVSAIVARSDGVPLFAEELTLAVRRNGLASEGEVPATLRDLLTARLDTLGERRVLLEHASVIGRDFSVATLSHVEARAESEIDGALSVLLQTGLIERAPDPGVYLFRHALIQDAAFESVLRSDRRPLHARVAKALTETGFADQPARIASHHEGAAEWLEAAEQWARAAEQSTGRLANETALEQLTSALGALEQTADVRLRERVELGVQRLRVGVLQESQGMGSAEVEAALTRALELGERNDDEATVRFVWERRQSACQFRGEYRNSEASGRRLLTLLGENQHEERARALISMATSLINRGEYRAALARTDEAAATIGEGWESEIQPGSFSAKIGWLNARGLALWALGRPDQASRTYTEAIEVAEKLGHLPSRCLATNGAAFTALLCGEIDRALALTDATIATGIEHGYSLWIAQGSLNRACIRIARGELEAAAELRGILAAYEAVGAGLVLPSFLGILASAEAASGEPAQALETVDRALAMAMRQEDGYGEGELHRIRGEILAVSPDGQRAGAEDEFRLAIDHAQEREARSWELRAAVSLARWLGAEGRAAEVKPLLEPLLDAMPEGSGTGDRRAAEALLAASG